MVVETPEIYRGLVKPYVEGKRGNGRLDWVYNILEHKAEKESIIVEDTDDVEGFILLPDMSVSLPSTYPSHLRIVCKANFG